MTTHAVSNPTDQTDAVKAARELIDLHVAAGCSCRVCLLLCALVDDVERLRKQVKQTERDAREDARDAAAEARWQERQGEDYGTY